MAMVLVLAVSATFVYVRLRADLDEGVDTAVRSRADTVAATIEPADPELEAPSGGTRAESDESFAQVLTPGGRVLDATGSAQGAAIGPAEARRAAQRPVRLERRLHGIDGTVRMLARPAADEGRLVVVVAGQSLEDRDDTLAGLLVSFLIGGPIAVLLASVLGYLLATAGFRPVEAMRSRAERISLTRTGERLPLPLARDEIRRLGETLNEMIARLESSFERERRFVADASHEMRTPLSVLKTELETAMRSARGDEGSSESLTAALEETDHLAQLAEDLLVIASASDGSLPLRLETVELRRALELARDRFRERARSRGREIVIHGPADLRAKLDPLRLRQALGNLIDNALRHGEGEIALAVSERDGAVEIEVADQGAGFPDELAPRAFDRFSRGDPGRTRGGAGLGLAIVRAIAEAHGGTATIVDGRSRGATIRLTVPLASSPAGDRTSRL